MGKVFLSYSRKDAAFVEKLHARLKRHGVKCFFDKESIQWGENWVLALDRGISESEIVVPVLSPDFLASEWTRVEWPSAMADDPGGLKRRLRPLLLRPCDELPLFLRVLNRVDVSSDGLFEKAYPQICRELGGSPREEPKLPPRGQLPPERHLPAGSRMPYRSMGDRFVGRVEALWDLHDLLFRKDVAVVSGVGVVAGTGGLGKTQLAIEYARRFGYLYEGGVWWVEADQGLGAMITAVSGAAGVEINGKLPEPDQTTQLWDSVRGRGDALLVLDNFPETGALTPFLPTAGNVQTLVTTRRRDLKQPKLRLAVLGRQAALELLNSGDRSFTDEEAEPLLDALGGLPLALELTCAFLNERKDLTPSQLLAEMGKAGEMQALKQFAKRYRDELPSKHELDVAATFQVSWDLLGAQAKRTLQALAQMAPAPVPVRLLRAALGVEPTGLNDPLADALAELERLSLAERDKDGEPSLHRLVRAFVLHATPDDDRLRAAAAEAVRREMEKVENPADLATYGELERLVPHAEALAQATGVGSDTKVDLWDYAAWVHRRNGRLAQAKRAQKSALSEAEVSFDPGHPDIAGLQSNLALVLKDLGELDDALDLSRKALASCEAVYGPHSPEVATSRANLATVLRELGNIEEARGLLQEALLYAEKNLEPDHPTIATRQSNLAMVLKDLGDLAAARDLLKKALTSAENTLGLGHPTVATRQSNLASVLKSLGDLEGARDLLKIALESHKNCLGTDHPAIAIDQSNLAMVLKEMGAVREAEGLLASAYRSLHERLGPSHPSTKTVLDNLRAVGGGATPQGP